MSSPVTIFPTVRRAGMSTVGDGWLETENVKSISTFISKCQKKKRSKIYDERTKFKSHSKSSTSRGQTPASITAWIFSLDPSERYDRAQHASVRTSSSFECMRRSRAGRAGFVCSLNFNSTYISNNYQSGE